MQSLEYVLNRYPLNHNQISAIVTALNELKSAPGLSRFLIGERCMVSDEISNNHWEYFYSYLPNDRLDLYAPLLDVLGFIDDDHLLFLEYTDRYDAALKSPFEQRLEIAQSIEKEIAELSNFHLLIKIPAFTIVSIGSYFEIDLLHHARIHLALTTIALEHYRLDHNDQLPETLTDLIPDYLDAIPPDPYDGQPIKYQKTNPGYIVYSIGPNLTDDNGIGYSPSARATLDITFTVKRK